MMVDRSPYTQNIGQWMKDLDQATVKLKEFNSSPQTVSRQEINDLMNTLQDLDSTVDPSFWANKNLSSEGMHEKIEKALREIQIFQMRHPEKTLAGQRNVIQAITSLSSALKSALNKLDKNRNLRDIKLGRRVKKSEESKHS